jgi:hypothetical protein
MTYLYWILAALTVWYLSQQAGRLDRLHHRIDVTTAALDSQLGRRAGIVAELAGTSEFDPATSAVLAQVSHDALAAEPHDLVERIASENELTEALVATFDNAEEVAELRANPIIHELLNELETVCGRVNLSHSFHSEAVGDCNNIRNQFLVRFFHLAGHAQLPTILNLDTEIPPGLVN